MASFEESKQQKYSKKKKEEHYEFKFKFLDKPKNTQNTFLKGRGISLRG